MKLASGLVVLGLGLGAAGTALGQDTSTWPGAPDCRMAPVEPAPVGQVQWKGPCKAGYADGKGVLAWKGSDGIARTLEATLTAGQVQGEATLKLPDGGLYIGTVKNGVPDGKGYFRTSTACSTKATYTKDGARASPKPCSRGVTATKDSGRMAVPTASAP